MKKKITVLCSWALPLVEGKKSGFGGAEWDLWQIARELAQDDSYEVNFVVRGPGNKTEKFGNLNVIQIAGYQSFKRRRGKFLLYTLRFIRTMRRLDSDVYFTGLAYFESSLIFFVSLFKAKYYYRFEHDWETNKHDLYNKVFPGRPILVKLFLFFIRHADGLISQTEFQQKEILKNYGLKSIVINNAHTIPSESQLSSERKDILWVGRVHSMKRPELFLDLAELLPNYHFTMIGPNNFDDELFQKVENRVRQIKNLTHIPGVPREEIEKFYSQARIFVLTSEAEGQSNVIVEALKYGVPVVSLSIDPDGILNKNQIGFCGNGDMQKIKEFINNLMSDDKMRRDYSERAYNFAKQNFDITKIIEDYKRILIK